MSTFETLPASAIVIGPAAKGRRGLATSVSLYGHQAIIVAPSHTILAALCKQWGLSAPIEDTAEPVVVVSRFIVKEDNESDDGLGDGLDDDQDDGL